MDSFREVHIAEMIADLRRQVSELEKGTLYTVDSEGKDLVPDMISACLAKINALEAELQLFASRTPCDEDIPFNQPAESQKVQTVQRVAIKTHALIAKFRRIPYSDADL